MSQVLLRAFVAASWVLIPNGFAQAPSIREHGAFNPIREDARTAVNAGTWKEVVENYGSSALIAFHATFDCGRGGRLFYDHDPLFFYGRDLGVPATGSFEIQAADPSKCPGGIDAAVFADGHTEGNPVEVEAIFERRRGIYEGIGLALPLLENVAAGKETAPEAQAAFRDLEASASHNHALTGPERLGMDTLFRTLRMTIETNQGVVLTPSDKAVRRPPSYGEVAAQRSVTLEQAQAIVIGKKLAEWQGDLAGSLKPTLPK